MKIGSFDNNKPVSPASTPAGGARDAIAVTPEASAKVKLSNAAAELTGQGSAEFDAAKVDRIAQAIRDGKFEVNAEAVADKLIAQTRELLGPGSSN